MTYRVEFEAEHGSAELTHFETVDLAEIHASRLDLARKANEKAARGAIINIVGSEILASPAQIIDEVKGLINDLRPGCKLAFVARPEAQDVVSMIVTTVAHGEGAKVSGFADLDVARCWIREPKAVARRCGCEPREAG
ncbi:hypothetical protein [Maricaulis sp.]|uniref:hypothetical protein n=1 Tax=unclassified Maricaulis TaxID=2632371 RepID=UPI001B0F6BF5|nr:hypothetical protein [Maricaulis sp.]MBO6796535.1 hypothetical protein [Maricaulis sp.]